jgi:Asp-tRNA(Asn)/Glu-tRNA(Gln) amidotransferase A subunit family amidase
MQLLLHVVPYLLVKEVAIQHCNYLLCWGGAQVSLPIARVDGCPVGLGLMGPEGSDEALLEVAEKLAALLIPVTEES